MEFQPLPYCFANQVTLKRQMLYRQHFYWLPSPPCHPAPQFSIWWRHAWSKEKYFVPFLLTINIVQVYPGSHVAPQTSHITPQIGHTPLRNIVWYMIKLTFSMLKNSVRLMLLWFKRTLLISDARLLKSLGNLEFLVQFYDYFRIFKNKGNLGFLGFRTDW